MTQQQPTEQARDVPVSGHAPVELEAKLALAEIERDLARDEVGQLRHLLGLRSEALARVAARAESAEAEVVTLRAKVASVEAAQR